ncbi:MAG: flavin oxidoreductase/NADH oxidase [Clostridiaceae bacterium]|nr:flavin oxidoreductase/NADH oxidase [Clostridiaceae bacterium]
MTHTEPFRRFQYDTTAELQHDLDRMGLELPLLGDMAILASPCPIGSGSAPNRIAIQPMEGCDGSADGRPDDLTWRRYRRFAAGGAGLLWVEATAVVPEGRANPRQLWLHEQNLDDFRGLVRLIDKEARSKPYKVLQLTHSGRYSKPDGQARPLVAAANPWLDRPGQDQTVLSDEALANLVPAYVQAARLAHAAGFQAVDIKACHRYLLNELLSARTRSGLYGGSLENRSRLLLDIVRAVKAKVPIDIAVRLNAYDEIPVPYGWGVTQEDHRQPDFGEPAWLVRALKDAGVSLINITGGNPYYNPHVNRPYDTGPYQPPVHPLYHLTKLLGACRTLKHALGPDSPVRFMASGLTWLRHLAGDAAAGLVASGWSDLAGFGRQAFAYPSLAADLLEEGRLDPKKCCLSCGKCSEIMRDGGQAGCVIHDSDVYLPIYRAGRAGKPSLSGKDVAEHV